MCWSCPAAVVVSLLMVPPVGRCPRDSGPNFGTFFGTLFRFTLTGWSQTLAARKPPARKTSHPRRSPPDHQRPGPADRADPGDAADLGGPARLPATHAAGQRAPALRRARRGPRRAGAAPPGRGRASRGGDPRGGRGPGAGPLGLRGAAQPVPAPRRPAAAQVHAARAHQGDGGRVLRAGAAAGAVRRVPARPVLRALDGPVDRAGPDRPPDHGLRRPAPGPARPGHPDGAPARGRPAAPRVGAGVRRSGLPGLRGRVGAARAGRRPRRRPAVRVRVGPGASCGPGRGAHLRPARRPARPRGRDRPGPRAGRTPPQASADLTRAATLFSRMVGYVDRLGR